MRTHSPALPFALLVILAAAPAWGQSSSLFGNPAQRQPLTLAQYSWTYRPPEDPRVVRLNDLITVQIDEKAVMTSEGQMDRKKNAYGDLTLSKWIKFWGGNLGQAPFGNGEPAIHGSVDNKMRSQGTLETRDTLKFSITCHVVDIRPNGNLVLEGRRTIQNNQETWDYSLTGEIRPQDVLPNNTILSQNVADLRIDKREAGHVRDSYRRGWLLRWLDTYQPF